jgi:hypothetical protein
MISMSRVPESISEPLTLAKMIPCNVLSRIYGCLIVHARTHAGI